MPKLVKSQPPPLPFTLEQVAWIRELVDDAVSEERARREALEARLRRGFGQIVGEATATTRRGKRLR